MKTLTDYLWMNTKKQKELIGKKAITAHEGH
jgi:hypothetical protein